MPLGSAFTSTCNISSALAPLWRKNSLTQHFFIQKSKTCDETVGFTSQWGGKHQKLLVGNNAPGKCLHAHMQHFFRPSSANKEKFAESAFFYTKTKHLSWNRWIYEPIEAKHQKQLLGNNAPASAFRPTCNLSSALAPLGRKNSLSQHFFTQKSKTCQETIEFTSRWGKHRKLLLGNNATRKCLHAHMQHFFSPSSANDEKFAESAFFHTKIKNLSWNHWIYEPMGAKHKKHTRRQQCPWEVPSRPHATFLLP